MLVANQVAGMMSFNCDFSGLVKEIGTVIFIRLLLVMAGVERNPGPKKIFVFRYQYLLIEVGTEVLRLLFDTRVGNDFMQYLNANPTENKQLMYLRNNTKCLNDAQKKLLPPDDMKPTSSNFDITLLALLLRNVCGLCNRTDPVWTNIPAPGDLSVEADITRLRCCRNNLQHHGTVFISEAEFNAKWDELCEILKRLGTHSGITNLTGLIDDARHKDIDEVLQKRHVETVKAWAEINHLFQQALEELKQDMSTFNIRLETIEQKEQGYIRSKSDIESGILNDLIECYKRGCKTLPVSPLFDNKDESILTIYQHPTMNSVKGTKLIKQITCYEDVFCKDNKPCNQIYITGDAGTGKTSFCTFVCLLWSIGKSEDKLAEEQKELQTDVDYMCKFDFVFYLSLRDTEHSGVIEMIKEQYLKHYDPLTIQDILRTKHCLILLDGLDEWTPRPDGRKEYKIPDRIYSKNCTYLTTSRPYQIESVRLSNRDDDHYIQTTGLHKDASKSYVEQVISYMNKENSDNRQCHNFLEEIEKCGLDDQLCIPMLASHLVVLWFEKTLIDMPRALIYANILEMLFRRAKKRKVDFPPYTAYTMHLPDSLSRAKNRKVDFPPYTAYTMHLPDSLSRAKKRKGDFPPSTACTLQLPDSLSRLEYLNEYAPLLFNVCHLSFRSLFEQDENVPSLVFTRQQLQAEPYCFSTEETDFLCKIGILSKNEVFGCYSEEKLKISFIHKSYIEFFASLFTSSFDTNNVYADSVKRWKTLNDVLQFENFFLLLAGFSYNKVKFSIDNIYLQVSDDIKACNRKSMFHIDPSHVHYPDIDQMKYLQNIVTSCYKEVSRCNDTNIVLKLEDYIFYDNSNVDILRQLLLLNRTCVKSIYSVEGKYYDEFDQIKNLQCLHVGEVFDYDVKFTECMLQNQSTLHTVCIGGGNTLIPELPVRSLLHLTSLSLYCVKMQHNSLHNLVTFLSDNVLIKSIQLYDVLCDTINHSIESVCTWTLNLSHHTKLTSLCLEEVNILCNNVNSSSLKSITLNELPHRMNQYWIYVFNCIKDSQLEHLHISAGLMIDYDTMEALADTVKTLRYIKSLILRFIELPDDVLLQLHHDVTQVEIDLMFVNMSRHWFHCFIESCLNSESVIKVVLGDCMIHGELSEQKSLDYMSKYLTSIPTVNITYRDPAFLHFEIGSFQ